MLKYVMIGGVYLVLDEKRGARLFRELLLFSLLNILILSVVLAYSAITKELVLRGESVCAFFNTFHLYCPGCGGSRSLLSLVRFNFLSSFLFFPALIPSVILFLYFDFLVFISIIKGSKKPLSLFPAKIIISIPVIILLNFLIRNVLLVFFGIDYISFLSV